MSDINSENAVMRERARIRKEVIELEGHSHPGINDGVYIRRSEVLKILSDDKESN